VAGARRGPEALSPLTSPLPPPHAGA
jgi:hypothetical protein